MRANVTVHDVRGHDPVVGHRHGDISFERPPLRIVKVEFQPHLFPASVLLPVGLYPDRGLSAGIVMEQQPFAQCLQPVVEQQYLQHSLREVPPAERRLVRPGIQRAVVTKFSAAVDQQMQYTRVVAGRRGGLHREPLRSRENPEHADPGLHVRQAEPAAHAVRRAAFGVIALCGVGCEQKLAHAGMQTCEACDGISSVIDDFSRHAYRRPVLTQCLETYRARDSRREIAPFGMERNVVIG